jgi:hypothetical protein
MFLPMRSSPGTEGLWKKKHTESWMGIGEK